MFVKGVQVIAAISVIYACYIYSSTKNIQINSGLKVGKAKGIEFKLPRVAHAGGAYLDKIYTNSLDALNHNLDKYDAFEMDFVYTADGVLVCSHGWSKEDRKKSLGDGKEGAPSYQEFLSVKAKKLNGYEACSLDDIIQWLDSNPSKYIVTDIKDDNVRGLNQFLAKYPLAVERVIPQIYSEDEYKRVKDLGFKKIIFTLYRSQMGDVEFIQWMKEEPRSLYAVTMWHNRAPYITINLAELGVPVYVHTVNSEEVFSFLKESYGVTEIYTDTL